MTDFSAEEARILNALYAAGKPLTTQKVADSADMSWKTTKKYLAGLREQEFVEAGRHGRATYWWLQT
jgi:DNA-binding IclR family transcriptional regulator